ncbi:hypothetical protein [Salinibacillus xinjiangensis]|uniref:Uncharacterized protein n=1 Tax=Salinibacillus xinjiangensis TaxID=1229268 RepID=A0A6G1XB71_9BACI|nr:hypothetical protein [Salinibacillus xinjiangensis]MRG88261.1 hypothetical protein [Salinibacillus xinjiangensis]
MTKKDIKYDIIKTLSLPSRLNDKCMFIVSAEFFARHEGGMTTENNSKEPKTGVMNGS